MEPARAVGRDQGTAAEGEETVIDRHASNAYTCPGKVRYLERRHAKAFARRMRKLGGELLRPYQCTACGQWHLGHTPKGWR
jgi:rubrerythrin